MREPHLPDNQASASPVLPEFIGESVGVTNLKAEVAYLLARQGHGRRLPTLLLQGETGTGKGLLARSIHKGSIRATRPFVDIDCAAIPETLLEAELFGVERGAYTDARQTRPGLFQTATGGTLFLDEIGLLPRSLQAKLLKVVEERGVRRLGSTHSEKVDVWLLAATNVNLAAAVRDGSFREDLYHRLAAVTLMLPPLRSREGDILLLAEHFLERMCSECRLPLKTLAPEAVAAMLAYRWPGNVRELLNRLERVVLMSGEDTVISAERLGLPPVPAAQESQLASREPPRFRSLVDDFERERLLEALRGARGNISMTAARLGLPRNTLRYRMVKLGIEARDFEAGPVDTSQPLVSMSMGSSMSPGSEKPAPSSSSSETRQVSLLGVDVRVAAGQSPGADRILELTKAKVYGLGGRVEARHGSRLVATFGVYPCEDAAVRAAHVAMAVSLASKCPSLIGSGQAAVRFAIHACEASVRCTKSSFMMDEQVRQKAEGVLGAMLDSGEPAQVLVSQAAARLVRGRFKLESAAVVDDHAGSTFRLMNYDEPGRKVRQPSLTPLIGRRDELDLLDCLFARAGTGRGQVVGIVGEPGVGKSRLLQEFSRRLTHRQLAYRRIHFVSYGHGLADLTVAEVLREIWVIAHEDDSEVITGKVRHGLENLDMDPDRWAPYLLLLFGVRGDKGRFARLGRDELKLGVFDALRRVAVEMSKREPLIIEVEDLQLFGKTAGAFLSYLVENMAGTRILFLTSYGPQYHPPWVGKSYVTQLPLQPLARSESRALVGTILSAGASERLTEAILAKAEGNPFFLEELARSAVAAGETEVDLPVPEAVQDLVKARMDHLEDGARRLLCVAAAIGHRVPAQLLGLIYGDRARLAEHIAACKRLEFIHEEIVEGEPVYVFKDALVWEVAHQSVPVMERRTLRRTARLPD